MNIFSAAANWFLLHGGSLLGAIFKYDYKRRARNGRRCSARKLRAIVRAGRNSEYGRKYGFSEVKSLEDYRSKVPLSDFDDYRGYVDRIVKHGEQKLLTSRRIHYLATTSGTVRELKLIPQIPASYIPYFKCICMYLNDLVHALRARGVSAFSAKGFLVTEIIMSPVSERVKGGVGRIRTGGVSSYAADGMKLFLPLFTQLPREVFGSGEIGDMKYVKARFGLMDRELKYFGGVFMSALTDMMDYIKENAGLLIRDIENGTIDPSIEMSDGMRAKLIKRLRPDPERAAELREIFSSSGETPLVSRLWPKMSYVVSVGSADFEPFTKKMRSMCSDDVSFSYAMYAASEGLIGCAMRPEDSSYLLLLDSGFYEFLPVDEKTGQGVGDPLLMHELETGKRYEIIVTNLAGLYRYCLRDVVRVTGFEGETPYIEFGYRANHITDICGVHLTGEYLAEAVYRLGKELGVRIADYSVFANAEHTPPRLEIFIEAVRPLSEEEVRRGDAVLDRALSEAGWDYSYHRIGGGIAPAIIRPLAQGTCMKLRLNKIEHGASVNQLKVLRLVDRPEDLEFLSSMEVNPLHDAEQL